MFASNPSFSDSCRALYDYMASNNIIENVEYVWAVDRAYEIKDKRPNVKYVRNSERLTKEWFRYIYHIYTSKYLFTTHSYFDEANPHLQKCVCLWHGTMLKAICKMNEREKHQPVKSQFTYFTAPSNYYQEIFEKSFGVRQNKVIVTGYPRNDYLFQENDSLEKLGVPVPNDCKLVVYMPTFRVPKGASYFDSQSDAILDVINLKDSFWMEQFNDYLKTKNIYLLVKLHPYDSMAVSHVELSNISVIPHKELDVKDVQLYHILHYADAMITDYSSIFCDYMLLNRPICFVVSDYEQYSKGRGFVFENPLDYLPGLIVKDYGGLLSFINDVSQNIDSSCKKRESLQDIYNMNNVRDFSKQVLIKIGVCK